MATIFMAKPLSTQNTSLTQRQRFALISLALLILITFCMGLWQLSRAHNKQLLIDQLAEQEALPPLIWQSGTPPLYRPVQLVGSWLHSAELLLDHRIENGQIGYQVITPFQLKNGDILLVNRGWWPDSHPPQAASSNIVSAQPWPRFFELGHTIPSGNIFQNINPERFATWAKQPKPQAYALMQQGENGLIAAHSQPIIPPERHLAYTATWWAMALAGAFLWFRFKKELKLQPIRSQTLNREAH
jgi:surfeit locus 1 family protein